MNIIVLSLYPKSTTMRTKKQPLTVSKEVIKKNLSENTKWMERALIELYNRQTTEEQQVDTTIEENGIGFNGFDAKYLSYVAKYLKKSPNNHLNDKHKEKCGKMLPKYWKQVSSLIEKRVELKKQTETI